jgi:hypothetical protein
MSAATKEALPRHDPEYRCRAAFHAQPVILYMMMMCGEGITFFRKTFCPSYCKLYARMEFVLQFNLKS